MRSDKELIDGVERYRLGVSFSEETEFINVCDGEMIVVVDDTDEITDWRTAVNTVLDMVEGQRS